MANYFTHFHVRLILYLIFFPSLSTNQLPFLLIFSFKHAERILSTRISLLRALREQERADRMMDDDFTPLYQQAAGLEKSCLLQLSQIARKQGQLQTSMNAVTAAYNLITPGAPAFEIEQEFAKVLWAQNEHGTAISLIDATNPLNPDDKALLYSRLVSFIDSVESQTTNDVCLFFVRELGLPTLD